MVSLRWPPPGAKLSRRIRQYDDNYQTFFYINPTTNETSWTRPGMPLGQVHPEQSDAWAVAHQPQGAGGHAADFMNAGSTDTPVPGNTYGNSGSWGSDVGTPGQTGQGERGYADVSLTDRSSSSS
jgi:hypothetical protein